jgi:transposase-like protein
MAERGVEVDHSTIACWVLHFSPILNDLIRREMRRPNRSWRVDETYVRVAGRWIYLYRRSTQSETPSTFLLSPNRLRVRCARFYGNHLKVRDGRQYLRAREPGKRTNAKNTQHHEVTTCGGRGHALIL